MADYFDDEGDSYWDESDFFSDDDEWERVGSFLRNKKTGKIKPATPEGGLEAIAPAVKTETSFTGPEEVASWAMPVMKAAESLGIAPKDMSKLMAARGLESAAGLFYGIPSKVKQYMPYSPQRAALEFIDKFQPENSPGKGFMEVADDIRPDMLERLDEKTQEIAEGADSATKEFAFTAGATLSDIIPGLAVGVATGAGPLADTIKSPILKSMVKASLAAGENTVMTHLALAGTGQEWEASKLGALLGAGGSLLGEAGAAASKRFGKAAAEHTRALGEHIRALGAHADIANIVDETMRPLNAQDDIANIANRVQSEDQARYEQSLSFADNGLGLEPPERINRVLQEARDRETLNPQSTDTRFRGQPIQDMMDLQAAQTAADNMAVGGLAMRLGAQPELVINKIEIGDPDPKGRNKFTYPVEDLNGRRVGDIHGIISTDADGTRSLHIVKADINPEFRSNGDPTKPKLGVKAYIELLAFAKEHGLKFKSDSLVSEDAARVYDAMERRGHSVTRSESAKKIPSGRIGAGNINDSGPVFEAEYQSIPSQYRRGSTAERATMMRALDGEIAKAKAQARSAKTGKVKNDLYAKVKELEYQKKTYLGFDSLEEERLSPRLTNDQEPEPRGLPDYHDLEIDLDGPSADFDAATVQKYGLNEPGVVGNFTVKPAPDGPIAVEAGLQGVTTKEGVKLAENGTVDVPADNAAGTKTIVRADPTPTPPPSPKSNVTESIDLKTGVKTTTEKLPGPRVKSALTLNERTTRTDVRTGQPIPEPVKPKSAPKGKAAVPAEQTRELAMLNDRTFENWAGRKLRQMKQWFLGNSSGIASSAGLNPYDAGLRYDNKSKQRIVTQLIPHLKEQAEQAVNAYRNTQAPVVKAIDAQIRAQAKRTGESIASIKSRAYRDGVNIGDYSDLDPGLVEALKIGQKNISDFSAELRKRGLPEKVIKAFEHEEGFHLRRDYLGFYDNDWIGHLRRAARSSDPVAMRQAEAYNEALNLMARDLQEINPDLTPEQAYGRAQETFSELVSSGEGDWQHVLPKVFKRAKDNSLKTRVQNLKSEADFIKFTVATDRLAKWRAKRAGIDPNTVTVDIEATFENWLSRQRNQKRAERIRDNYKKIVSEHMSDTPSFVDKDGKLKVYSKSGDAVPVKRLIHAAIQEEDFPTALREALGEVEDPILQQQRTITTMAHDIGWYDFWNKTMNILEQNGMSSPVRVDGQYDVNIGKSKLAEKIGNLKDVYIPKELAAMFDAVDNVHNETSRAVAIMNAVKYGKVMAPGPWMRNVITVPIMTTMAGDTAWMGARALFGGGEFLASMGENKTALRNIIKDTRNVFGAVGHEVLSGRTAGERNLMATGRSVRDAMFGNRAAIKALEQLNLDAANPSEVRQFFTEADRRGLLEGGSAREIMEAVRLMDERVQETITDDTGKTTRKAGVLVENSKGNIRTAKRIGGLLYKAPDTVALLTGYVNRAQQLAWAESGESMKSSVEISPEILDAAAESVKQTYQNMRRTPMFFKKVSRFPLSSTFVTFSAEMGRNMINNALEGLDYTKKATQLAAAGEGVKASKYGILAINKAMGIAAGTMMIRGIADIGMRTAGWGKDQLEAFRESVMTRRSQSSPPVILDVSKDPKTGKTTVRYLDGSSYNPYSDVDKLAWNLTSDKPPLDKAKAILWQALSSYAFPIGIGAKSIIEGVSGNAIDETTWDTSYRYVDNPNAPALAPGILGDEVGKRAYRTLHGMAPTLYNAAENMARGVGLLEKQVGKREYDVEDEALRNLGWSVQEAVIEDGLSGNFRQFADKSDMMYRNAKAKLAKIPRSDMAGRKAVFDQYETEWKRLYGDMQSHVRNSKIMGKRNGQTYDMLDRARVGNEDFKWQLVMGKPISFTRWYLDKSYREREEND